MRVGYLHLPRFSVQRRIQQQPSLKGQPLVLWAEQRSAQRVVFASEAAEAQGARPGMTVAAAAAQVSGLLRLPYRAEEEERALLSLGEALLPFAPAFELDAPSGLWLDASAAHLFKARGGPSERGWLDAVLARLAALDWQGVMAVGSERFTTQALARFGSGEKVVVEPKGGGALQPLPLDALEVPGQLGEGGAGPFRALGLTTLGEVAALPLGAVSARFGAMGSWAARLARGEDDTLLAPAQVEEKLVEAISLDWPAEALEPLLFAFKTALDRVCARLQGRKKAAVVLALELHLEPGAAPDAITLALRLARPSAQAKLLLELTRHRLTELKVERPVVGIEVGVDEASDDHGRQLVLGDQPAGEAELEVVLSRLASALGEEALLKAEMVPRHRPESAFSLSRFSLSDPSPGGRGWSAGPGEGTHPRDDVEKGNPVLRGDGSVVPSSGPADHLLPKGEGSPSRLLPRPEPVRTEETPAGNLLAVYLLGRRRKVTALFGPQRLAGEWWSEAAFSRDYYRVELEEVGALWLYRDGKDGRFYAHGMFD